VFGRAYRYGRGQLRSVRAKDPSTHPNFLGLPLRLFVKPLKPALRIAKAWLSSDEKNLFSAGWDFHFFLGYAVEAFLFGPRSEARVEHLTSHL